MGHKKISYVIAVALVLAVSLTLAQKATHKRAKSGQQTATQQLSINVASSAPPPLAISTTSLPDGKVGVSYSSTLAAMGGTPPYNWAVTTGTLPDGLALDAAGGVIAGNPTQAQSKTFTITVTDSGGGTPPPTGDDSIIVVPNPTFSIQDGQSKPLSAIGNVTGQPISVTWAISPSNGNATLSSTSGSATTFACGSNGHTGSPYAITATFTGLASGTTSGNCLAVGSETIINSSDCSVAGLTAAWGQMTSGAYIIQLPSPCPGSSGTYTSQWAPTVPTGVTSVTIRGGTTVNCTGTHGTSNWTCVPTDRTVLIDNYAAYAALWAINLGGSGAAFRITGVTFQGSPSLSTAWHKANGVMTFSGSSQSFRIDHIHINLGNTYQTQNFSGGMTIWGSVYGVVDHIRVDNSWQQNGIRSYGDRDSEWSKPTRLGSADFLFIEDNEFNAGFVNDCGEGARQVVRYNVTRAQPNDASANSGGIQTHVTAQGDPTARGCRVLEMYHNYQMNPTPNYPTYAASDGSSGTGLRWGDIVDAGINNDIGFLGHLGRTLSANNCGGGGGNLGGCPAPPNGYGYCGSNSSSVLSVWDGNSNSAGYPCIDQTGRGQGDLLSGSFPNRRNTTTGCVPTSPPGCNVWPHNKREPWYSWNETITGHPVCFSVNYNGVAMYPNRDYYCQVSSAAQSSPTSPFNGSAGTGWGTLANRPTNCTAGPGGAYDTSPTGSYGVGYFATDALGGNGVLYVCTSTNVWTNIYTPYTYPHPLTATVLLAAPFDWMPVIWIALLVLAVAVYFLRKPIIKRFSRKGPNA
jgi:hypothetical protein